MAGFRDPPFNVGTLARRLGKFWAQAKPHPLVAADAINATKSLLIKSVPGPCSTLATKETQPQDLLQKLYSHKPLLDQLDSKDLRHAIFVTEPRPDLQTSLKLLKHTLFLEPYFTVLRTELYRKNWLEATKLLSIVPATSTTNPLPIACCSLGAVGLWAWSPYWLVGGFLASFWLGMARLTRRPNPFKVDFIKPEPLSAKLEMAHLIVSWYDETMALTLENYHRRQDITPDKQLEKALNDALRNQNIQRRNLPSKESELYGDYWTGNYDHRHKWEWVEPDQDPANLRFK